MDAPPLQEKPPGAAPVTDGRARNPLGNSWRRRAQAGAAARLIDRRSARAAQVRGSGGGGGGGGGGAPLAAGVALKGEPPRALATRGRRPLALPASGPPSRASHYKGRAPSLREGAVASGAPGRHPCLPPVNQLGRAAAGAAEGGSGAARPAPQLQQQRHSVRNLRVNAPPRSCHYGGRRGYRFPN
ncbi:WAS/WASL-interacting protein family member 1-like [Schistocerca gregaria]|uniref:WAS/WASL-interacting protein family member 1-like n=1 Tax=Schistocerca gregaria TaxID=7010 RepID=UPI00211E082B|nr:WAS/WASL-interacting protein family member 1-like [Schistocerca gregaria]